MLIGKILTVFQGPQIHVFAQTQSQTEYLICEHTKTYSFIFHLSYIYKKDRKSFCTTADQVNRVIKGKQRKIGNRDRDKEEEKTCTFHLQEFNSEHKIG